MPKIRMSIQECMLKKIMKAIPDMQQKKATWTKCTFQPIM